jgi:hypothetical protein
LAARPHFPLGVSSSAGSVDSITGGRAAGGPCERDGYEEHGEYEGDADDRDPGPAQQEPDHSQHDRLSEAHDVSIGARRLPLDGVEAPPSGYCCFGPGGDGGDMFRQHWRDPHFWNWWWRNRLPLEVRAVAALVLLALLLGGGWFAAGRLSTAHAGRDAYVLETTVQRVVTVREKGKLVRKLIPVVRRVVVQPSTEFRTQTQYATQVVTTPGGVRIVRKPVIRYVPKIRIRVVTNNGRVRTVSETRLVPTTKVETRTETSVVTGERTVTNTAVQTQTVVNVRTVTNTQTETVVATTTQVQTETEPPVTVTETQPAETVTVTVTVPLPGGG